VFSQGKTVKSIFKMLSRALAKNAAMAGTWSGTLGMTQARAMSFSLDPSYYIRERTGKPNLLGKNNPESIFYEGPERDLVNFPRRKRPIERPIVRFKFIPEEFFQVC